MVVVETNKTNRSYSRLRNNLRRNKAQKLKAILGRELDMQRNAHLPLVSRHACFTESNQFVHQYPDGKTLLIHQNSRSSYEQVIRQLS